MIKVKDLIEQLKQYDPDLQVVIRSQDGASPCCGSATGTYTPDSTWFGELGIDPEDPEYKDEVEEYYVGDEPCIVLDPTN